jgi:anti-sigma factor RsiW
VNLSRETMMDLMALADGELEGADRERVERLVAENSEARRVVDAMRSPAIGAWLEGETAGRTAAADGIAGAVMAKLPARRGARGRSPVVVISIGAALALAAGVALILRSQGAATETHEPVASVETPSVDMQPPPAAVAQQRPTQGVEVDEVDSPSRGISVFEIPVAGAATANANGPSSVVIMIEDEGKK